MNTNLNKAAVCYVALFNNVPVAFMSVLQCVGYKGIKLGHRLVILPDFQGVGIASCLLDAIGQIYFKQKLQLDIVTSQPALFYALSKNSKWVLTRKGRLSRQNKKTFSKSQSAKRMTFTFVYKGGV